MSEQEIQEEKAKENLEGIQACPGRTVQVSQLLGRADEAAKMRAMKQQDRIEKQIANNQELYATLSRSILECLNDVRDLRKKYDTLERMIFSLQQGVNKMSADLYTKTNNLDVGLNTLMDMWNEASAKLGAEVEPKRDVVADSLLQKESESA